MNSQPEFLKHVFRFGRIACARDQKAEKLRTVRCVQGGKTGLRGVDELLPFTFFSRGVRRQKIRLGFSAGAVASCGGVSFAEDGPKAVDLQRPGELFLSKGYELGTAIVAAALFLPPPVMLDQMAIVPVLFQETAPVGHVPQEVPAIGSEGEATSANPVEAPTPPSSPEEGLPIDIECAVVCVVDPDNGGDVIFFRQVTEQDGNRAMSQLGKGELHLVPRTARCQFVEQVFGKRKRIQIEATVFYIQV